jgi:hypothetical protein
MSWLTVGIMIPQLPLMLMPGYYYYSTNLYAAIACCIGCEHMMGAYPDCQETRLAGIFCINNAKCREMLEECALLY